MQAKNAFLAWKEKLNPQQLAATTCQSPYTLVLAGAGSGKTSVLIARLLYLFLEQQEGPAQVLAVTFTNKAANEMRQRLANTFEWAGSVWMGTFHSIAHRLLRWHSQEAGLSDAFTVIDSEDQQRLCRRILKEHEVDDKVLSGKTLAYLISREKDAGRRPADTLAHYGGLPWLRFYEAYQQVCDQSGLVDFGELLLRSYELLANHPHLLNQYQRRFRHILVDEFQDTNALQYQWIKLLAGESASLFVVGDDDQSIYGWRGAEVANIQDFVQTMQPCTLIRLEQNYRSTPQILTAANAVIAQNSGRLGKELWSAQAEGKPIDHYCAINDYDEARWVLARIQQHQRAGHALSECAILYRANHQSRVFEQVLTQAGIAYRVTGGTRFFERAEIKDALGYARLLINPQDDAAFDRVINLPTRGLGAKSLEKVQQLAQQLQMSRVTALRHLVKHQGLSGKALAGATQFLALFPHWQKLSEQTTDLGEVMKTIIHESGLWAFYGQEAVTGEGRQENLAELINSAQTYQGEPMAQADDTPLSMNAQARLLHFLTQTALDTGDATQNEQEALHLMTIHAAKGLEFAQVFLTGLEEGIFPTSRATDNPHDIEEERRLMYVGMTRAKRSLHLSSCLMRRIHGVEQLMRPSRFIDEIPHDLLKRDTGIHTSKQTSAQTATRSTYPAGKQQTGLAHPFPLQTRVMHPKFGQGVVIALDGFGEDGRVQVRFSDTSRWLMLSLAKLERV